MSAVILLSSIGGESGKVHSTVRNRWNQPDRDTVLVDGMRTLGCLADEAVECLRNMKSCGVINTDNSHTTNMKSNNMTDQQDDNNDDDSFSNMPMQKLGELMKMNFSLRRKMYGDAVVGSLNIAMVDLAASLGLSAKFTGSGGALVCIREDGGGW